MDFIYKDEANRLNGDGVLLYPGNDFEPLASINLEVIRDGIEDYEYYSILKNLVAEYHLKDDLNRSQRDLLVEAKKACQVSDSIVKSLTDYTNKPNMIFEQRIYIADMIEKLIATK